MSRTSVGRCADTKVVQAFDHRSRTQGDAFRPDRIVTLIVEDRSGPVRVSAHVVELTVRGCELRVHTPIEAGHVGRLRVHVRDATLSLPVRTRNKRRDSHGWTIDCAFDLPTADEQRSIYALVSEHDGQKSR